MSKENSELKESMEILQTRNEDLKNELNSVTANYENIRKSYKKLVSSNEEMSLELVSLFTAKVCSMYNCFRPIL